MKSNFLSGFLPAEKNLTQILILGNFFCITTMRFPHHKSVAGREAGFIRFDAGVFGGILAIIGGALIGAGVEFGSHALMLVGIIAGALAVIFYAIDEFRTMRYREELRKRLEQD